MATVEVAGATLHYDERGPADGPGAVVVHGLASDAAALAPLRDGLAERGLRAIAYDRRGYGGTPVADDYLGTTVQEQAEDLSALVDGLGLAPALVVGDDFGALVALDLALRHPIAVRRLVLVDPPLLALVPEATESLGFERLALDAAVREHGPAAAVDTWAAGAWAAGRRDAATLERARAAHRGFLADYAGLASLPVTRRALRELAVPCALVTGPDTPPPVAMAADRIAALVPGADRRTDGDALAAAGT
jgi:pimeloyl-ACP methyl ester carboxylesterase